MSYGLMPYRCNIEQVEALFGKMKDKQCREIATACESRFAQLDSSFGESFTLKELLNDYAKGEIKHPELNSLHWYLFEQLCDYYGYLMNNCLWNPAFIHELYSLKLLGGYNNLSLPVPEDFPSVYACYNHQLVGLSKEIETTITDSAQQRQFLKWINYALLEQQDLILFYY